MMKIFRFIKRTQNYCRSHMWCSFAGAIILAVILVILVTQYYLKNEYLKYLIDSTYDTEQTILTSMNQNIKNQLDDFIRVGSEIAVNENNPGMINKFITEKDNYVSNKKDLKEMLATYARYSQSISAISIASKEGLLFQYERNEISIKTKDIWNEDNNEDLIRTFYQVYELSNSSLLPRYAVMTEPKVHPDMSSEGFFHIAYPVRGKHYYQDIQYIMIITYDRDIIENMLHQLNQSKDNVAQGFITDESDCILYHEDKELIGARLSEYAAENNLTNLSAGIGNFDWNLNVAIDKEALQAKVNEIYTKAIGLYVFVVICILLMLFWATQHILRPVDVINRSIKNVKKGNMQERIEVKGTNEIWQLAGEYNGMMHAIRKMNRQVAEQHKTAVESLKMKQRAEREALESQINAHFICNTLNAINYEAIESGNFKVSVLLKKLSNILRYTFDQKHQNVYMFQEISWIEQYLFLQKERLENVFDYTIEFDREYDNWPCRKLMLQPFVENSILHGFEGRESGGMIRILGEGEGEYLKISIEDNGMGMPIEKEAIIREVIRNPVLAKDREVGIGISNVIMRMQMYYGERFCVEFETRYQEGTRFTFYIPDPRNKQEAG